ncbi:MAG: ABC transporter ATP-binding protein [Thermodesulfobacteriota bacterium]
MSNNSIKVENLNFSRNGRDILENVSFSISEGDFLGIIGPNGAGKTTLLKLILMLLKPISGEIYIEDKNINDYIPNELYRKIAFVPQENNLDFPMTVIETVLLGRIPHLNRFQLEKDEDYRIARRALKDADIENFSERYANQLSMGEKQLVSIAKALAQETKFIILDEPTSSLDVSHTIKIMEILKGFTKSGKTIISVIHDLNIASRYCNKVLVIDGGIIKGFGAVKDVFTQEIIQDSFSVNVNIQKSDLTDNLIIEPLDTKN